MAKKTTTFGRVREGKLFVYKLQDFYNAVASYEDCDLVITIEKAYGKRSSHQNRYYWGVVIPAFCMAAHDTTGEEWSKEVAHDTLKARFLSHEFVNESTGEILNIIKSTAGLSTVEFMDYIENCRKFILEWFGAYVPSPNEDDNYYEQVWETE